MLTKNFARLMAMVLERNTSNVGYLEAKATNGTTYYLPSSYDSSSFPYTVSQSYSTAIGTAGIILGSGNAAATEDDYTMQTPITSGLSVVITQTRGLDGSGNPYIAFDLAITNNGSSSVTIREIGYIQNLYTTTAASSSTGTGRRAFLIDRTVLSSAVTIAAGQNGVIRYTLKTEFAAS